MKKLILLLAVTLFLLFSCQENQNPLAPNTDQPAQKITAQDVNWISIPLNDGMSTEGDVSITKTINGIKGGSIKLHKYLKKKNITIDAKLTFSPYSFLGDKEVTLSIGKTNGNSQFSPSSTFLRPASYTCRIKGLDLSGVNPDSVDFVYEAEDGSIEHCKYDKLKVKVKQGILEVVNAQLPHFSRYGWLR